MQVSEMTALAIRSLEEIQDGIAAGDRGILRANVKAHDVYDGEPQTVITRARVELEEVAP